MSKIVKKKDLDVLIENTMAKAGIISEEVKIGGTYIAQMPTSTTGKERIDIKVKLLGKDRSSDYFVVEPLEDKRYTNPESGQENEFSKGKHYNIEEKYLKPIGTNESKLNIGKLINEGDYYGSFGDMGKWYDEQDREYEMEDGDWDEDEYATWEEYSNSPYGASASNRWSINPSAKSGGWNPEMAFNQYVDTHGPMRVRRRKMTQPDMMESKSNKKPLINESIQKELDRFNRLSNYTFKK